MRETLLEISLKRLALMRDCTEKYDSYWLDAKMDMFSPIPTTYAECEAIGKFLVEIGSAVNDYELVGIGQTFISESEALLRQELGNAEREEDYASYHR